MRQCDLLAMCSPGEQTGAATPGQRLVRPFLLTLMLTVSAIGPTMAAQGTSAGQIVANTAGALMVVVRRPSLPVPGLPHCCATPVMRRSHVS